ncbi:cysteine proteinase [Hymenopellis radicata]|nr:cysteine proteinase [Hymenopellis radicata]
MPPAAAILKHSSLAHFQASGHPVSVKLGTITRGKLSLSLDLASQVWETVYMASVLQTRFSLPAFQERYYVVTKNYGMACDEQLPADCVGCQMHKVADGLLSGRYSHPANYATEKPENDDAPVFQAGIKPTGFKALIGKGHEEFSTMRQQDSEEFLTHLLTVLRRDAHKHKERADPDATAVFSYSMEQRLQCGECKKVRYSVDSMDVVSVPLPVKETGKDAEGKTRYEEVPLWDCLGILLGVEALEYSCPSCTKSVHALRWRGLNLLLHRSLADMRHIIDKTMNWVLKKLDILPDGDELVFTDSQLQWAWNFDTGRKQRLINIEES